MIEVRKTGESNTQETGTKPARITTSMIITDLENGIDRTGIQTKYNLEAWEVKQMFQHPTLKGKKAKKVRKLSFEFVDDTIEELNPRQTSIPLPDETGSATVEEVLEHEDVETLEEISFDDVDEDEDDTKLEY